MGCHFLLQCMKVKREREVAQSCSTLSDPMDCSPPGSSVHGIFQARVLEWAAIAFSIHFLNVLQRWAARAISLRQAIMFTCNNKAASLVPVKNLPAVQQTSCNMGDQASIPGLGSSPGEGNGNPLQHSCLENPMDGGAWRATVMESQRIGHD